jgi:hypothetical protein
MRPPNYGSFAGRSMSLPHRLFYWWLYKDDYIARVVFSVALAALMLTLVAWFQ